MMACVLGAVSVAVSSMTSNKHRVPPELSLEEVCAATASEAMTRRTSAVLHLDRVIEKALENIVLHHPRHAVATDDVSSLALCHLVGLYGMIPEDSWWGMSLVWVSLCLHQFCCKVLYGSG